MKKSVKFYHYHPLNDGPVLIKLNAGQTLHHSFGGPTDEGWSSESNIWEFDGKQIRLQWCSDGRDCDGRLTRAGECYCKADLAQSGNEFDGVRYPAWEQGESSQRDEYAEAAGY